MINLSSISNVSLVIILTALLKDIKQQKHSVACQKKNEFNFEEHIVEEMVGESEGLLRMKMETYEQFKKEVQILNRQGFNSNYFDSLEKTFS